MWGLYFLLEEILTLVSWPDSQCTFKFWKTCGLRPIIDLHEFFRSNLFDGMKVNSKIPLFYTVFIKTSNSTQQLFTFLKRLPSFLASIVTIVWPIATQHDDPEYESFLFTTPVYSPKMSIIGFLVLGSRAGWRHFWPLNCLVL